jgi:pimeloyl-ACP methyl ester carboxylesterase
MMEFVTSRDGTSIAYAISGEGAPLLLVHGMLGEHRRWGEVTPALARTRKVAAMDRRGRGGSGDGAEYTLAREAEDIASVIDALGGKVDVLAHSFGAMASMEAAKLTGNVRSLLLYEPMLGTGPIDWSPRPELEAIERQALTGDREGALRAFYRDFFNTPTQAVDAIKVAGYWEERLAVIHTCPREGIASRRHRFDPASVAHIEVPVLLLLGGESPPVFVASAAIVRGAFANTETVILPGQGHYAMATAPDLLARETLAFLDRLSAADGVDRPPVTAAS